MTLNALNQKTSILVLSIPFILILTLCVFINSQLYIGNESQWSSYIIIDFILTIPLLFFILIRKTKYSNLLVVPFFIGCVALASYLIPTEHQNLLGYVRSYGIPLIELVVISIVIYKVTQGIKSFRKASEHHPDFYSVVQATCKSMFPKTAAKLVANEIALLYYGFFNFKKTELRPHEYSNYKGSGILSTLGAIIFVVGIEMVTIHYFASKWSVTLAWILTGLSIYSALQLIGIIRSVPKRPIKLQDDKVLLRFGILSETHIPLNAIESISFGNFDDVEKDKHTKTLSLLGQLEQSNTIIELKSSQQLDFIYGKSKTYQKLLLFVDDHQRFKEDIEKRISKL